MDPNYLIIALVGLIIGLVKGGIGGPIAGALILPMLSQTMSVPAAVGISLPLLMVGDAFAMRFYWREWDVALLKQMLPAAIVGIVMGTLLLVSLSDQVLRYVLGIFTLGMIAYKLLSDSLQSVAYTPRPWHGYLAGWASGLTSALANLGGPPITTYLLLQKLQPVAFVGTLTLFFTVVNALKLPGFLLAEIIDLPQLLRIAWVMLIIPLGVWFGRRIIDRFPRVWFERFTMVLLFFAALLLFFG